MNNRFSSLLACVLTAFAGVAMPGTLRADLVGYWSLDGDTDADAGGWGASTIQPGPNGENDISFTADVPGKIAHRVSQSVRFDTNNDDRLITGFRAGAAGMTGRPPLTLSFWVKRTENTPQEWPFVQLGDGTGDPSAALTVMRSSRRCRDSSVRAEAGCRNTNDPRLVVDFYNVERWEDGGVGTRDVFYFGKLTGTTDIPAQWVHVAVTYRIYGGRSFPRLFLDGQEISGKTEWVGKKINLIAEAFLSLGGGVAGEDLSDVRFSELALWNEVLAPHEVKALANGYAPTILPIRDCDYDGIDDRDQLVENRYFYIRGWDADDPLFHDRVEGTPEVDGMTRLAPAAPPLSDVTLIADTGLRSWAFDGDPSEYLLVYVNGTYVGRLLENPGEDTLVVPQATWETLREGGEYVNITLELSAAIDPPDGNFAFPAGGMLVNYTMDRDVDDNGWLDECVPNGDPSGPDTDGDGVSDHIDRSPNTIADPSLVDVYGQLLRVARFDADEDGDVDVNDFDLLDAAVRDVNGDGDVDLHDIASILHGARGPGVAADPAFRQQLQLFKAHTFGPEDLDLKPWHKPLHVEYGYWYDRLGYWEYDSTPTYRWRVDRYAPSLESSRGYINCNERAWLMYGTHLAAIDKSANAPLSQGQQIAQLNALTAASGSSMSWIGMRWQRDNWFIGGSGNFRWDNGQIFDTGAGSLSNWVPGGTIPGSFSIGLSHNYYVFTFDNVGNGAAEDYYWLNGDGITPILGEQTIEGFVAQLPANTVPAAPTATTETVTVTLDSSLDGQGVLPGQTVDWTISFEVSSGDNSGLALLVTDLAQDGGNPATLDLPAANAVPAAMQNFAAPLGFTGPGGYVGQQAGTPGALNLVQIGGAQNTFGGASSDTSQGQGTAVVSGLGQSGSTVLATGSFTAPAAVGTYTFSLANTLASVLKTVGRAGEGSEIVPANLTLAQDSISIVVNTPPEITLLGDNPATHEAATVYSDAGATASDVEDGDISGSLVVSNGVNVGALGSYSVTYNVADSSGLAAPEVTRTVNVVDTTAPVITLLGDNPITINAGDTFTDPGATALDSLEGDVSSSITVSGTVNTLVHGTNVLTYNVTDGSGNAATPVTRTVFVDGDEPPTFAEATVPITIDEATTGIVYRSAADDPDGGVRFDHPDYLALFPTDEGTGAGASDALGSGLGLSFDAARWAVEAGAPGGENVLNTADIAGGNAWFTVDDFNVTNGLTVSEWIRFDDIQTSIYDPVIWKFGDMRVAAVNGQFGVAGPGGISMPTPFVDGEWAHLTFSVDAAGNATFYLNGAEILSGQVPFDASLTGNTYGHDFNTINDGLDGARSDLTIIDGVLSPTQAEMLYQSALLGHLGDVLRYSLGSAGDEGFFTIDPYTGELSVTSALSYEVPQDTNGDNVYQIEVIATDDEGLSSSQVVEVTINNSNIAPVITGTPVDPIEEVSGYYVYDFTVADADTPAGNLTMQVTDSRFTVSSDGAGGYRVHRHLWHRFDYEKIRSYDFDLIVSDGVEEDRVNIAFTLVNINDNAPVVGFTSAGPVTENDPGVVVGVLDITDPDGPTTFYFDLDPRFEVAADQRTVKLKDGVSLDYEEQSSLVLGIIVSDGPFSDSNANWGGVSPTIEVLNVNDVAPSNIQLAGTTVSENAQGAVVGTLSADDADGPSLGFTVSDARFEVDGSDLKLVDGTFLDRETEPSVTLTVTVSDGTFQDSREFTITVLNVDEGPPADLALSNATIAENTTGVIGELGATDVDGDAITFSVTDSRFSVNGATLSLTSAINHESLTNGTIALEITAAGGGASTTETFLITIEDVNEAPSMTATFGTITDLIGPTYNDLPVLENSRQVTIAFSADPGETRYPVSFKASDEDGDALTWVLTGVDAAAFRVDPATGGFSFVTPADFEAPADANGDGVYEVTVSATDGELSSNTISFTLIILDTAYEPYETWAYEKGLTRGVNDGRDQDPDNDGCPNWKEFAEDGDPLSGMKTGKKRLRMIEVDGRERLALTIPVRSGAVFSSGAGLEANVGRITYLIQGTGDMVGWDAPVVERMTPDDEGLPALNPGWDYRTFILDADPVECGFLRLALTSE